MNSISPNSTLHYRYVIAALIIALCIATGFGLSDDPKLVDKISFALTVNSLVLGVVAIGYTFIASNKQEAQLVRLLETNSSISTAASDIRVASTEIKDHFHELPGRFDQVDRQLEAISQAAFKAPAEGSPQLTTPTEQPETANFKDYFLNLRYIGIASLYLYYRAYVAKKPINQELCDASETLELIFHVGNYQAAEAAGYLKAEFSTKEIMPVLLSEEAIAELQTAGPRLRKILGEDNKLSKMIEAIDKAIPNNLLQPSPPRGAD